MNLCVRNSPKILVSLYDIQPTTFRDYTISYYVRALAVAPNGDVYVGGEFTQAGGIPANNIARWNGTAWSALGTGTDRKVNALAVAGNGDVYAGGYFGQAGGVPAATVARWNGTAWNALGQGAATGSSYVDALAVASNGDVYAGGHFSQIGGTAANYVARWNGSAWNTLGQGTATALNGDVTALVVASNGDVYAGGYFSTPIPGLPNRVARWNGTGWSGLGNGPDTGGGIVYSLALTPSGEVYAGGMFYGQQAGVPVSSVSHWNGTSWSLLGRGVASREKRVYALATDGSGGVYAGGYFDQVGGTAANSLARWNGTAWLPLALGPGNGLYGGATNLAVAPTGEVYAGGEFFQAGGVPANFLARWNGTAWSNPGAAFAQYDAFTSIQTVAVAPNGDVYVGGRFSQVGGIMANGVARWNGSTWSSLGTGTFGFVLALAVAPNGDVYAGGDFTQMGGQPINYVARWNGTAWSSLGTGLASGQYYQVRALVATGAGDVYASGYFTQAGGTTANSIARWNGTAWSALGTGLNGTVLALAADGTGNLYAGGSFTQAGGAAANYIARWNGSTWSSLGTGTANGTNSFLTAIAVASNGDVYVGGGFTQAGGAAASCIAKWNGSVWSTLGTGLNDGVRTLAIGPTGKLYASGSFTATGDDSRPMVSFAIYDPNAPLSTAAPTAAPPAALFPNPAHHTATLRLPADAPRRPLTLTDAQGRTVRRYPAPAGPEAVLDVRGLPAGVYFVQCGRLTQRLVVE